MGLYYLPYMINIALIQIKLFVLLHRSIRRFSVGPKGVEFEMRTEDLQAYAKSQNADDLSRFER